MNNSVENSEWQKQVCNYQEKKKISTHQILEWAEK